MVLLRGLDERGLRFYTSYFSRKGRELTENPAVAALLAWPVLARQVRVEGTATPLSEQESDEYFGAGRAATSWRRGPPSKANRSTRGPRWRSGTRTLPSVLPANRSRGRTRGAAT